MFRFPVLAGAVLALCGVATAQTVPRTPDGKPDFHGYWTSPWTTTLERGPEFDTLIIPDDQRDKVRDAFVGRLEQVDPLGATYVWDLDGPLKVRGEYRSSFLIDPPDGRLPYTQEGRARRAAFRPSGGEDHVEQRALNERCLMSGSGYAPFLTIPPTNVRQIIQTVDHVVFFTEGFGQLRLVPLDGGSGPAIPRGGVSKGHWDGDTLVIETTGFLASDSFRIAPLSTFAISPTTRITERFTLNGPDEIVFQFTVEDPAVYTRPWTGESAMKRSQGRVFEWACHEGNYSMTHILLGAREAERSAQARQ